MWECEHKLKEGPTLLDIIKTHHHLDIRLGLELAARINITFAVSSPAIAAFTLSSILTVSEYILAVGL